MTNDFDACIIASFTLSLFDSPMKIWFNKVHESRRSMVETDLDSIAIGRDAANQIVLNSPLVSKRQAVVHRENGKLRLENIGINSCMVGDAELIGGESLEFSPGETVRIWPYTLTFESEEAAPISRAEMESHLRSIMADLELRVHAKLLERFDLYELESRRMGDSESILLLERQIEDVCRELAVVRAGERSLARRNRGTDAAGFIGQPIDSGKRPRRTRHAGPADLQRVRRARHAGARTRNGVGQPAALRAGAVGFAVAAGPQRENQPGGA